MTDFEPTNELRWVESEPERNRRFAALIDQVELADPHSVVEVSEAEYQNLKKVAVSCYGITDLTNAVDSRNAAVKAAEDFAACEIRCHLLHGQLLAELGRLKELSYALDRERADAVIRVQAIAVPTIKQES